MKKVFFVVTAIFLLSHSSVSAQSVSDCPAFTDKLQVGAVGEEVLALQNFLKSKGYFEQNPTGYFGSVTLESVQKYKQDNSITPHNSQVDKDTGVGLYKTACSMPLTQGSTASNNFIYTSPSIISVDYTIGEPVGKGFSRGIQIDTYSATDISVVVTMPNTPSWVTVKALFEGVVMKISKGKGLVGSIIIDPTGLSEGEYKTSVIVTGNFPNSPVTIPVILKVSKAKKVTDNSSIKITNPLIDYVWTIGDTETFKWSAKNISPKKKGTVELINSKSGQKTLIAEVKNNRKYKWRVGDVYGVPSLTSGEYNVKIQFGDTSKLIGPLTLEYRQFSPLKNLAAKAYYNKNAYITSENAEWTPYILSFTGGKKDNPISHWELTFTCPDNVVETSVKVDGEICNNYTHRWTSGMGETGDVEAAVSFKFSNNTQTKLKVHAKAIGSTGGVLAEKNLELPIKRGS